MVVVNNEKEANDAQEGLLEQDKGKTNGKIAEDLTEEDNEGVPMDSGWAWVIAFSIFNIMTVIVGFNRSLSVLFMDISEQFRERATSVSLMFTIHSLSSSVASIIVSNIIMAKVTVRKICVFSSVANFLVSIALSLAPNFILFLLLFIFKGIFFGTLLVAPMSLIGFYFKKRRSFASSLATTGMCVAFIAFPPITSALREEFGMRGSFLVIAAIELHLAAFSLLLRPVDSYKQIYNIKQRKLQHEEERRRQQSPIYKGPTQTITMNAASIVLSQQIDLNINNVQEKEKMHYEVNETENELHRKRSQSDASHNRFSLEDNLCMDIGHTPNDSPAAISSILEISLSGSKENLERDRQTRRRNMKLQRQTSQLSAISMTELPYIAPELVEEIDSYNNEINKTATNKSFLKRLLNNVIDISLFKIWTFRMMALFVPLSVFANYTIIYMPVIGSTLKISKSDAALMMTLSGIMDLVTRIATGFIGDFKFISKPKLVVFSTFVMGTVCHCSRFFTNYALFAVYAALVGVFGGVRQNFFSVMLLDYVGAEKMAKAYGLASTLATLSLSVNHPVIAAMFDATGGFGFPLHYVGTMVYLGTIVLLFEPFFKKMDVRYNTITRSQQKTSQ